MTPEERDLLVSLVTAVVRLARQVGFEQTADDVLQAARDAQITDWDATAEIWKSTT